MQLCVREKVQCYMVDAGVYVVLQRITYGSMAGGLVLWRHLDVRMISAGIYAKCK